MSIKVTAYHNPMDFGRTGKSLANLERIAQIVGREPTGYKTVKEISEATDLQPSWIYRLMKDRPGFVRVIHIDGTNNKKLGWYYEPDFEQEAIAQGYGVYPINTVTLVRTNWPKEVLLTTQGGPPIDIPWKGKSNPDPKPLIVEVVDTSNPQVPVTMLSKYKVLLEECTNYIGEAIVEVYNGNTPDTDVIFNRLQVILSFTRWLGDRDNAADHAITINEVLKNR